MVLSEEQQEKVEMSAEVLYGLIHARYVLTSAGLAAVWEKYQVCCRAAFYSEEA